MSVKEKSDTSGSNILLVANYESDVGYAWWLMETYWAAVASHFADQGRKSYVIFPRLNKLSSILENAPLSALEIDFCDRSKTGIRKLRRLVIDKSIKCVYLTDRGYYDQIYYFLRKWGVKCIVNHDHTPGDRPPAMYLNRFFKTMLHRSGLLSCDHYIGVSRFVYDRLIENACVPSARCSYVLNGIRPLEINPRLQYYAHEQFGIPADGIIVVSTGRATYYKGIDFIIKCANILINSKGYKDIYFLHCGDGPDLNSFKSLTSEYRIESKFIFAGRRNDVRSILPSCDIGFQASLGEAFSLSILEYLSAGLATIVPDNCGNSEAINNGVNGFIYKTGDAGEAIDILENLISDAALRKRVGRAGAESVESRFNIERAICELLGQLDRMFKE